MMMVSRTGTAEQANLESQKFAPGIAYDLLGYRQNAQLPRSVDGRSTPRKPTPSPLQVSETVAVATADGIHHDSGSPKSPTAFQATSLSQSSPSSPRPNLAANLGQPRSTVERLDETSTPKIATISGDLDGVGNELIRATMASPSKAQSYSQLRNASSPLPQPRPLGNSSPPSPRSTASPPLSETSAPSEVRPMPRTSSIDSAISKHSLDNSNAPDISDLIETAGSPEAVIQHLLKEKQYSAVQNTQLWKLVDKQRSLLLGLNQDLEKALKDKERYRKELKEYSDKVPPIPRMNHKALVPQLRDASHSPARSEASTDLPIQRQSLDYTVPQDTEDQGSLRGTLTDPKDYEQNQKKHQEDTHDQDKDEEQEQRQQLGSTSTTLEEANDWVRSKPRAGGPNYSHKATSSSDLGVHGPVKASNAVTTIQTSGWGPSDEKKSPESPSQLSQARRPVASPASSFTAKRSQPFVNKAFDGPSLALTDSTLPGNDTERMTPPRKPPPAPLHLGQPKSDEPTQHQFRPDGNSDSEYDEDIEVDELPALERGRKKTREADDREREAAMLKEKQDRSHSKKEKGSKPPVGVAKSMGKESGNSAQLQEAPITPSVKALSLEPPTAACTSEFLSPPASLASILNPSGNLKGPVTTERLMIVKPMSPGLPLSPRPNHRPTNPPTPRMPRDGVVTTMGSPPLSPRNAFPGLPLSPKVLRQPFPHPPNTPMSLASRKPANLESRDDLEEPTQVPPSPVKKSLTHLQTRLAPEPADASKPRVIFRGFMSDAYPELLIPPNALPSIVVKVVSSRLKPSRHSLVLRGNDEEPVFTLGISARSFHQELWQVERPIQSLLHLDQQLRQSTKFNVKLPDRSLFSGHAPAKIDARRVALEQYFESILDTQMDEKTALALCYYLSTQASEPTFGEANGFLPAPQSGSPVTQGPVSFLKEGYLTKKGKNFGGWKARYFVLEEPVLRYHETPGGSVLGTIKLHNAHIGRQSSNKSLHSPSRGPDDNEGHYRHAFLIREPKRKDKDSFMDHVLCAESDAERDSWVAALLHYVDGPEMDSKSRPPLFNSDSGSSRVAPPSKKNSLKTEVNSSDSPNSEKVDSLQAVPYEDTKAAQPPHVLIIPDPLARESPSPTTSTSQPSVKAQLSQSKAISAPSNGTKINDVGAWGNKPMSVSVGNQREHKKRSIWGFRDKNAPDLSLNHSNDSNLSLTQQQYQEQITNVKAAFGAPLADAVEYCGPRGVDVCLPAVVYRCLEYLENKDAWREEGIFRMSGSNVVIKSLKKRFNAEGDFDFLGPDEPYFDVHAVASLLKLYLRELPQPVLTRDMHLEFIAVLGMKSICQVA